VVVGFSLAPANAHELSVAEGLLEGAKGWVLADTNYWSPNLTGRLSEQGLDLLAPYKKSEKGKKIKGRKRHLLANTEGFVLKARVHSAKVMDYEGIKTLLRRSDEAFPRLSHLWLDGGYKGEDKGADWVEKTLGWTVEIVSRPRKPAPEEVLMAWAREWAKEGVRMDWQNLMPPQGFQVLPRRWVVERTFSWTDQNRRMSKDYERLPETAEAFTYVAMSRLMLRRLARA
jgi:putative transposase